jgi:hypothetical protein
MYEERIENKTKLEKTCTTVSSFWAVVTCALLPSFVSWPCTSRIIIWNCVSTTSPPFSHPKVHSILRKKNKPSVFMEETASSPKSLNLSIMSGTSLRALKSMARVCHEERFSSATLVRNSLQESHMCCACSPSAALYFWIVRYIKASAPCSPPFHQ